MEAGYRTAGDGNEQEREQSACKYRAAAVYEVGNGGHFQLGADDDDPHGQS